MGGGRPFYVKAKQTKNKRISSYWEKYKSKANSYTNKCMSDEMRHSFSVSIIVLPCSV